MSRLSDSTLRHVRHDRRDSHDTCLGASPQRGLGWTCPPHFSRSCSCNCRKSRALKTELVHASTTASSSSDMLEQVRHDMHGERDTLVTTRDTSRDAPSGIWAQTSIRTIDYAEFVDGDGDSTRRSRPGQCDEMTTANVAGKQRRANL